MSVETVNHIDFPKLLDLGEAEVSRTAAEAAHLSFHGSQHPKLDRIKRLGAALISEMEKLRDTPPIVVTGPDGEAMTTVHPCVREASIAITQLQTSVFWCASAVISTIKD